MYKAWVMHWSSIFKKIVVWFFQHRWLNMLLLFYFIIFAFYQKLFNCICEDLWVLYILYYWFLCLNIYQYHNVFFFFLFQFLFLIFPLFSGNFLLNILLEMLVSAMLQLIYSNFFCLFSEGSCFMDVVYSLISLNY